MYNVRIKTNKKRLVHGYSMSSNTFLGFLFSVDIVILHMIGQPDSLKKGPGGSMR